MKDEAQSREALVGALEPLSMVERATYVLSAADRFSHAEIAFRLGISTREVEVHLASALARIGMALETQPPE